MANLMRTSNPALNERAFRSQVAYGEAMTLQGTVNKTGLLLLCVVVTAAWWLAVESNKSGRPSRSISAINHSAAIASSALW